MKIEKLQYITQETETLSHIDCVREACISGVKWIQLRVKNKGKEEYLELASEARVICDLYDAQLIINDSVEVAIQVNADGVHLGKSDLEPEEARKVLGDNKIIGGTANTIHDVEKLINKGVDYIGLGPYQYTKTKENLSPFLGLDGYYDISQKTFDLLKNSKLNNNIPPIIAVGGIEMDDVRKLMKTGVYGIAVSNMLTNDFSKTNEVLDLLNEELTIELQD